MQFADVSLQRIKPVAGGRGACNVLPLFAWCQKYATAAPLPFRPFNPALCGSRPLVTSSRVRLPLVAAVYQRQLSVPSLRGRLMSTSESWGVNGNTTQYTSPVSVVLQLRLVSVRLRAKETKISAALWALEARERTLLYFFIFVNCH